MGIDWDGDVGRRLLGRLESDELVWLTTVSADGTPYPSLVWFWWSGSELLVFSRESPRVANIATNPRVSVNFNSDDNGGSVATSTGAARIDRGHPSVADHEPYLRKYRRRIEEGLGVTVAAFSEQYSVPVLVELERGQAW